MSVAVIIDSALLEWKRKRYVNSSFSEYDIDKNDLKKYNKIRELGYTNFDD
ncbi:hypothetical protein CE91St49_18030 [Emergencia timonensis]|nr:hypothetical protein CE91St48_18090 [Emergencia timonensis]BDF12456.1 hypothetical protein CE91St49_18030 [Emergencia timonensis]